jgi:uncharacterized protein (DUF433 family)
MESYKHYRWIVSDPDLLGGKLAIRETRLSVSFLLECLAEGMSAQEIRATYGPFPEEAIGEILHLAAAHFDHPEIAPTEPLN